MNARGRTVAILATVLLIGAAAAALFRFETQRKPRPPLIGVVHETEIRVAPEISARLASIPVKSGQEVRKGDVLAVLSSPEVAASLEEAKANAESARANLANVEAGVRQEERDTAAQNVAIAASNVTLAKEQFARVSVLAAKNYASKQQFDEDAAALGEAEASLALAEAALAQSKAGPTKEQQAVAEREVALALATVADLEAQLAKTTLTFARRRGRAAPRRRARRSDLSGPAGPDARRRRRPLVQLHDPRGPSSRFDDGFEDRAKDRRRRPFRSQSHRAQAARRIRRVAGGARGRRPRHQQLSPARRSDRPDAETRAGNDGVDRGGAGQLDREKGAAEGGAFGAGLRVHRAHRSPKARDGKAD